MGADLQEGTARAKRPGPAMFFGQSYQKSMEFSKEGSTPGQSLGEIVLGPVIIMGVKPTQTPGDAQGVGINDKGGPAPGIKEDGISRLGPDPPKTKELPA
jgi:hypothetical protein